MFTLNLDGKPFDQPVGKIICIGRNYADHAKELDNPVPSEPLLFMKPSSSLVPMAPEFSIPQDKGVVHHELEIALLVGADIGPETSDDDLLRSIAGVGLALDLTLREVQDQLKKKGHPWEKAKAFDGACPVSDFVGASVVEDWGQLNFELKRNGRLQQQGDSGLMLFSVVPLVREMTQFFRLEPGDLILTGTPAGVGPLMAGDQLEATLEDWIQINTRVVAHESV
jgi:2-keto-4-pentenoate hydratase/2-oxohepta-3-ene-1,7-dioic acid hydratase in catechol pathway